MIRLQVGKMDLLCMMKNMIFWSGDLIYLYPNQGYMFHSSNSGSFTYPTNGDISLRVRSNMADDENVLERDYPILLPRASIV